MVYQEPFTECGATTHVLRPGWSPEGSMLVSAHAMNGGGPTAQVVERGKQMYFFSNVSLFSHLALKVIMVSEITQFSFSLEHVHASLAVKGHEIQGSKSQSFTLIKK